jgi:ABC-type lipoprotein release transport system permease subunit
MKELIGLVIGLVGIALGLYVGVWLCLVGGIVDVIEQIRAENLVATAVAWGVAKVLCSSLFGSLSALPFILFSKGLLED